MNMKKIFLILAFIFSFNFLFSQSTDEFYRNYKYVYITYDENAADLQEVFKYEPAVAFFNIRCNNKIRHSFFLNELHLNLIQNGELVRGYDKNSDSPYSYVKCYDPADNENYILSLYSTKNIVIITSVSSSNMFSIILSPISLKKQDTY